MHATLEPRHMRLIGLGLPLLLVAALLSYLVVPQVKSYRATLDSQRVLQSATRGQELDRELRARSDAIDDLRRRLHGDMAEVPARELEAVVVGRLQDISWRHGVGLVTVVPRQGEAIEGFAEMLFEVELAGRYGEIFAWLRDVRGNLGFVVIKQFSLERRDQSLRDPVLTARLELASYRQGI